MNNQILNQENITTNPPVWQHPVLPGNCPGANYVLGTTRGFVESPQSADNFQWLPIENLSFNTPTVESVNGKTGVVVLTGDDINVSLVDSTKISAKLASLLNLINSKNSVSGMNDGTNWTQLTIDGVTKNIPQGGGSGGSVSWGAILGNLSNQTDLKNALDAKLNTGVNNTGTSLVLPLNNTEKMTYGSNNIEHRVTNVVTGAYIADEIIGFATGGIEIVIGQSYTSGGATSGNPLADLTGQSLTFKDDSNSKSASYGVDGATIGYGSKIHFNNAPSSTLGDVEMDITREGLDILTNETEHHILNSVTVDKANSVGLLSDLTTTIKTTIVAAINELVTLIAGKSTVTGTNDGTNWTKITIDGVEKNIPQGGSGGSTAWGAITGTLSNQTDLNAALGDKVDKVTGKGLSTNDYSAADKAKVDTLAGTSQELVFTLSDSTTVTVKVAIAS